MSKFFNAKQYNDHVVKDRYLYPTSDMPRGVVKVDGNNKAVSLSSHREHAIDVSQLQYHDQKEFFNLD